MKHFTLCYYCAKATTSGCCWSEKLTPVEGWKAKKRKLLIREKGYVDSYNVYRCPEFVEHELCKTEPLWQKELMASLSAKF